MRKEDLSIMMGDFKAKIGRGPGDFVRPYGLGVINERGGKLNTFCNENSFVVIRYGFIERC